MSLGFCAAFLFGALKESTRKWVNPTPVCSVLCHPDRHKEQDHPAGWAPEAHSFVPLENLSTWGKLKVVSQIPLIKKKPSLKFF